MTTDYFTDLLKDFFDNPEVRSFRLMTQGKENTTALVEIFGGKIIVRMWGETHGYMGVHSKDDIEDEVDFMGFCYDHQIPVPHMFRSKSGNLYETTPEGQHFMVIEYVDGESPQHFTHDMTAQVATAMAQMHLLVTDYQFPKPRSWPGTVLDMTDDRIAKFEAGEYGADAGAINSAVGLYKELLKSCDLTALPKGVIHGDIMWENMRFKDGHLRSIFDFGDCRESYFVEDIAKSLLFEFESPAHSIFGENGENGAVFLRAYQKTRKLTGAEEQSLPLFFLSRIIYQFIGYRAKIAKGQAEYEPKASTLLARYEQHRAFFAQK